jgi:hypothetical protein
MAAQLQLQKDVHDIIAKAFIATEMEVVPHIQRLLNGRQMCAFELFGFDMMVDKALKPALVEVNISPALGATSELDKVLKCKLISDTLHLVGVHPSAAAMAGVAAAAAAATAAAAPTRRTAAGACVRCLRPSAEASQDGLLAPTRGIVGSRPTSVGSAVFQ